MINNIFKLNVNLAALIVFSFLTACGNSKDSQPTFFADENPSNLSDWGILNLSNNKLQAADQTKVYELKTALFSDYSHKLRTIWLPEGQSAKENSDGSFDFPVGTVISKTFYYPKSQNTSVKLINQTNSALEAISLDSHRLIETRLLVKRETAWVGLPYVWNTEQTEATLQRFGEIIEVNGVLASNEQKSFNYLVPDVNQCAGCHQWDKDKDIQPIGPQVRHLKNSSQFNGHVAALDAMSSSHNSTQADDMNHKTNLDIQARRYLDINCSHCHNPKGPGNTSGLHLEAFRELSAEVGLCKLPIAAGAGTGNREYDIEPGQPEESIISYRINSDKPDIMMPELGRSLIHSEGATLVDEWIKTLEGNCNLSKSYQTKVELN